MLAPHPKGEAEFRSEAFKLKGVRELERVLADAHPDARIERFRKRCGRSG